VRLNKQLFCVEASSLELKICFTDKIAKIRPGLSRRAVAMTGINNSE
jgi:hypothetical protein